MLPLLPDFDRSLCARPSSTGPVICGAPATVRAPEGSGQSWAYCEVHARFELALLEHEVGRPFAPGWVRHKVDLLRCGLEVC